MSKKTRDWHRRPPSGWTWCWAWPSWASKTRGHPRLMRRFADAMGLAGWEIPGGEALCASYVEILGEAGWRFACADDDIPEAPR